MRTNILKDTQFSIYSSVKDTSGEKISLNRALEKIRDENEDTITRIRYAENKENKDYLKRQLEGITWAGVFRHRDKLSLIDAAGFLCLDFDKVSDLSKTKLALSKSKYCFLIFISPSGNGLKMLVRIPLVISDHRYKEYYNAALEHYSAFDPDTSTKDISRLCFLSYDPELYLNPGSDVYTKRFIQPVHNYPKRELCKIGKRSEASTLRSLFNWWEKKHWDPDKRNNSLYKLACAFCEFGVSEESTWNIIRTYEETDLGIRELQKVVKSAYKRVQFNTKSLAS